MALGSGFSGKKTKLTPIHCSGRSRRLTSDNCDMPIFSPTDVECNDSF